MCVTFAHSAVEYQKAFLDAIKALQICQMTCQLIPTAMVSLLVGLISPSNLVQSTILIHRSTTMILRKTNRPFLREKSLWLLRNLMITTCSHHQVMTMVLTPIQVGPISPSNLVQSTILIHRSMATTLRKATRLFLQEKSQWLLRKMMITT